MKTNQAKSKVVADLVRKGYSAVRVLAAERYSKSPESVISLTVKVAEHAMPTTISVYPDGSWRTTSFA